MMSKVLVVATSRETQGGISAVIKQYEHSKLWKDYNCHWVGTHRDGSYIVKIFVYIFACVHYVVLLPFYDIVHFHVSLKKTIDRKYPLFKIAKLLGKKTIIHLHCGSQIDDIWNEKYQYMFNRCDCAILLSDSLKSKIKGKIGKSDHLRVVYNPCPIIKETSKYEKQNSILFSGLLNEGKGYKDLIKAFAKIAQQCLEWKLVLAGNGEEELAKELASELGIKDQVVLLGWVSGESKHKVFSEAKVFCLPSYAEGFPMAVLDAWSYGLPVIATPVGGVPDVAVDGENMLLFNPGDVDELSEKLRMTIIDDELRAKLSKESIKLATGRFSLKTVTDNVASIYDELTM